MRRITLALLTCLVTLPTAACVPAVHVDDDLDFELFRYELHTPYVIGSDVTIHVGRAGDAEVTGWTGAVEDQSVFAVDSASVDYDGEDLYLDCRAVGPGETRLVIRDGGGHVTARRTIRVKVPDRIDLIPAGLIKVRGDDAPPVDPAAPIRILAGGTATFEVAYYQGNERLFGNGALTLGWEDPGLVAEADQTYLFENREWLRLSPDATGLMDVTLTVGGVEITTLTVEAVGEDVIAGVELEAESTRGAHDDDLLYLLARAYDAESRDVWGVDFRWAVDGLPEQGEGDLFYYYYQQDDDHVVSGGVNGYTDEVVVFMSDGGVTSSNNLGCSAAGSGTGLVALLVPLLVLIGIRRRRRRRQG